MAEAASSQASPGFAEANGGKLYYELAGSGPPVVLIHSGITDSRSWDPQFREFAQRYRVLRYDLRGFGHSDVAHGAYSLTADLVAVMAAANIERAALVGVSLGSVVAVDFALEYPNRVMALVLAGPGISGRRRSDLLSALLADIDRIYRERGLDPAIERELEIWLAGMSRSMDEIDPQIVEAVREMDRWYSARLDAGAKPQQLVPPAVGRLGEVSVPSLIIVGDRDLEDVADAANRLHAGIRESRLVRMHGVAHVPNMERPDEFNHLVLDFLRSVT